MSTALGPETVVRSQWWRGQRWDTLLGAFVDLADLPDLRGGACVRSELPASTWDFHIEGETHADRMSRHRIAQDVCRECPLHQMCADYAADPTSRAHGVWGGRVHSPRRRD